MGLLGWARVKVGRRWDEGGVYGKLGCGVSGFDGVELRTS